MRVGCWRSTSLRIERVVSDSSTSEGWNRRDWPSGVRFSSEGSSS
jgi:hypothetical protein